MASLPTNNRWKRDQPESKPRRSNAFAPTNTRWKRDQSAPRQSSAFSSRRPHYDRNSKRAPQRRFNRRRPPSPPKAPDISSMEAFPSLGGNTPARKKEALDYKTKAQGVFNLPKHIAVPPKRRTPPKKEEEEEETDYNNVADYEDKCEVSDEDEYESSDEADKPPPMVSLKRKTSVKAPELKN